jgi:hypothetical protein
MKEFQRINITTVLTPVQAKIDLPDMFGYFFKTFEIGLVGLYFPAVAGELLAKISAITDQVVLARQFQFSHFLLRKQGGDGVEFCFPGQRDALGVGPQKRCKGNGDYSHGNHYLQQGKTSLSTGGVTFCRPPGTRTHLNTSQPVTGHRAGLPK